MSRVPFSFWKASGFTPASLSLSGWWRGNYTGAPWAGTASAGGSSGRDLVTTSTDPTTGTALNGITPGDFSGAQYLQSAADAPTLFTVGAGSIGVLYRLDTVAAAAPAGQPYDDAALFALAGAGEIIMAVNSTGLRCAIYDGAYQEVQLSSGGATGTWFFATMRWNSTQLIAKIAGVGTTSISAAAIDTLTGFTPLVGSNYAAGALIDGRIMEVLTAPTTTIHDSYANIMAYLNSRYALSLT